MSDGLANLRGEIDRLDDELYALLTARAHVAMKLGVLKIAEGRPLRDPPREAAVLERLVARLLTDADGPLTADELRRVYKAVMAACLSTQRRSAAR